MDNLDCVVIDPIVNNTRKVNGVNVNTFAKTITNHNVLKVETGTIGYKGGNSKYSGRTYFRLGDLGGTDVNFNILRHPQTACTEAIEITFGGDAELRTFIEALKWTVEVLEDTISEQR